MKRKIGRILTVNALPPLISFSLLSLYVFLFFIPELESAAKAGLNTEMLTRTLFPYTVGVLIFTAVIFIFSAVYNLRTEQSRERMKKSYEIIDEEYQTWVETTAEGFIFVSKDHSINANAIIVDMLGYDESELSVMSPEDIINEDADGMELLDYLQRKDDKITGRYETRLLKKDGDFVEVLISASVITSAVMEGFVLVVKDMSDKVRTAALRIDVEREYSIIELQSALQYIYQNAGSMMDDPLLIDEDSHIIAAVERMNEEHRNSFIVLSRDGYITGFVTDQDLRQRVLSGDYGIHAPVKWIMSSPVVTAPPEIMFFEAFRKMRDNSIRQLVIADDENRPLGLLTEKKLIEVQSTNSAAFHEELKRAETVEQLRDCYRRLIFSVRTLVLSGAKAAYIASLVSKTSETITIKLIEKAFQKFGPAPCDFAFLVLGSEGRGEQTLLTDQDNGIIFSDVSADRIERCRSYFMKLGKYVSDSLNHIGYSYCKGGVMASNAKWVKNESEWQDQILHWVEGNSPEKMLDLNIIFDFKCVYGDAALGHNLRKAIWQALNSYPGFLREIAATVSVYKPPLTIFGKIQVKYTEADEEVFDIKKALGPLILFARTMALKARLEETSTVARLRVLKEREIITKMQFRNYEHAFNFLALLRFRHQIQAIEDGEPLNNLIYIEDLSEVEIISLRKIFKQISAAQDNLRLAFTGSFR